jgi:hypothetical protein
MPVLKQRWNRCSGCDAGSQEFYHVHVLESVDKAKYLGVTISEDLKWESQINNICGKANKTDFHDITEIMLIVTVNFIALIAPNLI